MNSKKQLRSQLKVYRLSLDRDLKAASDKAIFENVINTDAYRSCSQLLVYVSGDIEVDTRLLIRQALADGKSVLAPRCISGTNLMDFCLIRSFDDLEEGAYGIYEPKAGCEIISEFSDALCIVPALAFDNNGYRIGFGKGFYDRFLSEFQGISLGICYDSSVIEDVYRQEHDKTVNMIVTENRTLIIYKQ